MTGTVRGCLKVWLQPEGVVGPETNPSIHQNKEKVDATEGKVTWDYHYEPEGPDAENEPDAQEDEENSNAEYAKVELPHQGTIHQKSMNGRVAERIK